MTEDEALAWLEADDEFRGEGCIVSTPLKVLEALGMETGGPFPQTPEEEAIYYNEG